MFVVVLEGGELVGGWWKWAQINKVVLGCVHVFSYSHRKVKLDILQVSVRESKSKKKKKNRVNYGKLVMFVMWR